MTQGNVIPKGYVKIILNDNYKENRKSFVEKNKLGGNYEFT